MMKKSLIALALVAAAPVAFAATSNVDVYGQVRMSVSNVDSSTANADTVLVSDHASRIGVKGTEDLGGGMSAVYGLEWAVNIDGGAISARNQFVGLKGGFGTVLVGRHDAPYKLAGSADLFADTVADATGESATGSATNPTIIGRNGFDTRASQTVAYITPDVAGFHAAVAMIPGEETTAGGANGLADAVSMTVVYKNGPLNGSVSYQNYNDNFGTGGVEDKNATKFNIGYAMGDIKVGYTYESSDANHAAGGSKDKGQLGSISYAMGPITLAAQYGKFDDKNSAGDVTTTTVGVVYGLSKRTSTYVGYADIDNQTAADGKILTVGLNHSF
jgi:predicted porin